MARPAQPPGPGTGDQLASQRAEGDVENRANALAADPWKAMEDEGRRELERANQQRDAIIQLQRDQRDQADANAQRYQESFVKAQTETQRLMNEATALANTHLVRDRRSDGRRFLDGIIGAIGGVIAAKTGGPNVGLQMILKGIDDDVQDQKDELTRKQGLLGMRRNFIADELGRSGDMFKAQEMYRLALHDAAIAQINNEAMKYDPNGTRAAQLAKLKMGVQQAKAAAVDALQQRNLKTAHDSAQVEGMLLENAQKRAKLGAMMAGPGAPAYIPTDKDYESATPPAGFPGTQTQWLDQRNKYWDGQNKQQQYAQGGKQGEEDRQAARERGGLGLVDYDRDGKEIEFLPRGSQTAVDKLRDKVAATTEIVHLMDEAMSIRTGWSSDLAKSGEWQKLHSLWGAAILRAKDAGGLGAISASDMDLIEKWLGTDDPTKMRGVEQAVEQSRRNFIGGLRTSLGTQGMSKQGVAKFDIPNLYANKPARSATDDDFQDLLNSDPTREKADRWNREVGGVIGMRNPATGRDYTAADLPKWTGMFPSQAGALRAISADAAGADEKKRAAAIAKLESIAKQAKSENIRKAAQKALEGLVSQSSLPSGAPQPTAGGSIWGGQ